MARNDGPNWILLGGAGYAVYWFLKNHAAATPATSTAGTGGGSTGGGGSFLPAVDVTGGSGQSTGTSQPSGSGGGTLTGFGVAVGQTVSNNQTQRPSSPTQPQVQAPTSAPSGGGRTVASDGQSLASQPASVQATFQTVYGANAPTVWVQQHEVQIAVQGNPGTTGQPSSNVVTVTTCKGAMTLDFLRSQLQGAGYGGPWDTGSMVAAFNRAACPG